MTHPTDTVDSHKWGRAALTAGPVADDLSGGVRMTDRTESIPDAAHIEAQRDAALASYGRIARCLASALAEHPHDGRSAALLSTQLELRGVDIEAATGRWIARRVTSKRGGVLA